MKHIGKVVSRKFSTCPRTPAGRSFRSRWDLYKALLTVLAALAVLTVYRVSPQEAALGRMAKALRRFGRRTGWRAGLGIFFPRPRPGYFRRMNVWA